MSTAGNAAFWDAQAKDFDAEPDHGLREPVTEAAWRRLLGELLPPAPARVADLGCGTGSLSVLLAEQGYDVTGVDLAPAMVARARAKGQERGVTVRFEVGDVAEPALEPASFEVVLVRHVLWAMPEPAAALDRWLELLRPSGSLVLIEGRWSTGAGLDAATLTALVEPRAQTTHRRLTDPALWGREIQDERYALVAHPSAIRH